MPRLTSERASQLVEARAEKILTRSGNGLLAAGRSLEFMLDKQSVRSAIRQLKKRTPIGVNSWISPQSEPFTLFAGGDIVPAGAFFNRMIRSMGNIFEHAPEEIFKLYLAWKEKYLAFNQHGYDPYLSGILTERARRQALGIGGPVRTHFDVFAEVLLAKVRDGTAEGLLSEQDVYTDLRCWLREGYITIDGMPNITAAERTALQAF